MAHKKAAGSTNLGRDSISKRLGVKVSDGEVANPGEIIVRQRGTSIHPGDNVRQGGDDTLYAGTKGKVRFNRKKVENFHGRLEMRTFVHLDPVN